MGFDWNDVIANGNVTLEEIERHTQDAPPPEEVQIDHGEAGDHNQNGAIKIADDDVSRWVGVDPPEPLDQPKMFASPEHGDHADVGLVREVHRFNHEGVALPVST